MTNATGGIDMNLSGPATLTEDLGTSGIDQIFYSGSGAVSLPSNIENVTIIGTTGVAVTANALSNILIGNVGADVLYAQGGNDTVEGGGGNDTLIAGSGEGDDLYVEEPVSTPCPSPARPLASSST